MKGRIDRAFYVTLSLVAGGLLLAIRPHGTADIVAAVIGAVLAGGFVALLVTAFVFRR